MEYIEARSIADRVLGELAAVCERVAVAGSVRRRKEECHDIEIVAVPKFETGADLFGNPMMGRSLLDPIVCDLGRVEKNGPRYKKVMLPEGIALDLFVVLPPAQWGVIYALRTGPAEYSQWLVTTRTQGGALPSYLRCADGALWNGRELVPTPEEVDLYRALGLEFCEPERRRALWGEWGARWYGDG